MLILPSLSPPFSLSLGLELQSKSPSALLVARAKGLVTIYLDILLSLLVGLEVGGVWVVEFLQGIFVVGRVIVVGVSVLPTVVCFLLPFFVVIVAVIVIGLESVARNSGASVLWS